VHHLYWRVGNLALRKLLQVNDFGRWTRESGVWGMALTHDKKSLLHKLSERIEPGLTYSFLDVSPETQINMASRGSALDRALRILYVEDDPHDRQLIRHWLQEQGFAAEFTDVDNEADFLKSLGEKPFDIILSDKSLPRFDGLTALRLVRERFHHVPFVFVTGSMGDERAIETIKDGATDYVLKDRLHRLIPVIQRAVREAEQAEKAREAEQKIRQQAALLDKAQDAILVKDVEDHILYWNKSAERIYGWPAAEIVGRRATELLPKGFAKYDEAKQSVLEKGNWTGELFVVSREGRELTVESRWTLVRNEEGSPKSILVIDTDITEKKLFEARFLRAQRMDSIGALASGIAHDLNNALAPVLIGTDLLRSCKDEESREKFLEIISLGTQRATALVKQILNFARGSGGQSGPVNLSHVIREIGKMIQETFPKIISFSVKPSDQKLWTVQGDATEFQQVLLNLCVNARDAMPAGGQLTLSAQNITLNQETASANRMPGPYVLISVRDAGTGIPPEVLPHIFEPFFTTKIGDKGTGLGLSTVAGIVKHQGGFIEVETEPGKGTEFKIYLPATAAADTPETKAQEVVPPTGHGELILVIEDEEAVRELTKTTLESYGYRVVTARNGVQGIDRFKEYKDEIRLLVTDTDMPHMEGMGAIRAIKELRPELPVIIASGSKGDTEQLRRIEMKHLRNLGKPYSLDQLLMAVGAALQPLS
jgi:two-component system, cell cycle sensor histidine kinase and response regulator CckA